MAHIYIYMRMRRRMSFRVFSYIKGMENQMEKEKRK